ncbi:Uncharacterised protein [Chlamydia trachomatis]|nr:Uncharacterised protein [Chlamydia trachomatis]
MPVVVIVLSPALVGAAAKPGIAPLVSAHLVVSFAHAKALVLSANALNSAPGRTVFFVVSVPSYFKIWNLWNTVLVSVPGVSLPLSPPGLKPYLLVSVVFTPVLPKSLLILRFKVT